MVKRTKTKIKSREAQNKGEGNKELIVISLEGIQETQKTNKMRDGPSDAKEKSNNGESKDPEAILSDQPEKDQDAGAEVIKDGESLGKSEEDSDSEEEEEEEGEIEMTTPRKKEKQRKEIEKRSKGASHL